MSLNPSLFFIYLVSVSSSSAFHTDSNADIASFPVIIFYASIKFSPFLLSSKLVNPHLINLSSYVNFPNLLITPVTLLCGYPPFHPGNYLIYFYVDIHDAFKVLKQPHMPIHDDYEYCEFPKHAIEQKICAGRWKRKDDLFGRLRRSTSLQRGRRKLVPARSSVVCLC